MPRDLKHVCLLSFALMSAGPALSVAAADDISWDRPQAIKESAERLVKLHKRKGSQGVLEFLHDCYRTHTLAAEYTQGLEECIAQDYMHSKVLARIYARVSPEESKKKGIPTAKKIADGIAGRLAAAFHKYKMSSDEAKQFQALVEKHGFPVFAQGLFPKAGKPETPGD